MVILYLFVVVVVYFIEVIKRNFLSSTIDYSIIQTGKEGLERLDFFFLVIYQISK